MIIAHRSNLFGPDKDFENTIEATMECFHYNFDVELDLWFRDNKFYLGHDEPKTQIFEDQIMDLTKYQHNVFWHCKDLKTFSKVLNSHKLFAYSSPFFHQTDDCAVLYKNSKSYLWTYPGKELFKNSIAVMPEYSDKNYQQSTETMFVNNYISGVCTDYPAEWNRIKRRNTNE